MPRSPRPPVGLLRAALGEDFYIVWFQEPEDADAALSRDVRRTLTTRKVWTPQWAKEDERPTRPAWLTEEDLGISAEQWVDKVSGSSFLTTVRAARYDRRRPPRIHERLR